MNPFGKSEATRDLSGEFKRDGYVAFKPLYTAGEDARLNAEIARFIRDVVPSMPEARVYYENKADKSTLKQLQMMFEYDVYFEDLMLNGPACAFRSIRPPIPATSGHPYRGIRPPLTRCVEAHVFSVS